MDKDDIYFNAEFYKTEEVDGDRIVYGVASTEGLDTDDQIVESTGLKQSAEWLKKYGLIDWNHEVTLSQDPGALLGVPLDMRWDDSSKAYVKFKLYKTKKASDVWDLIQNKARLGLSIGGKILERDQVFDPTVNKNIERIKKVFLNHIAVTPFPANSETLGTLNVTPYDVFMKSLHKGATMSEDTFESFIKSETSRIEELKKSINASENTPQEGSGGVDDGSNVLSVESLEGVRRKRNGKKIKILNKGIEFEINDDDSSITIDFGEEYKTDIIKDEEISRHDNVDPEKIVTAYIDMISDMNNNPKIVIDINKYLQDKGLNRPSRRIIKRHLLKYYDLHRNDWYNEESSLSNNPYNTRLNVMSSSYIQNGVVMGADENPDNFPIQVPKTPTNMSNESLKDTISTELDTIKEDELSYLKERLEYICRDVYYNSLDNEAVVRRFNLISSEFGRAPLTIEIYEKLNECSRADIKSFIRMYDETVASLVDSKLKNKGRGIFGQEVEDGVVNPLSTVDLPKL